MKHWIYILVGLPVLVNGQSNLVPNGDFETYTSCPNSMSQITYAFPWQSPTWNFDGSPDYFNVCASGLTSIDVPENVAGYQYPHSGNAYVGLFCFNKFEFNREYVQVKLNDTIIKRVPYLVSFWVSLADKEHYSISKLGAYFSETAVQGMDILNLTLEPQVENTPNRQLNDKENWMLITDTFLSETGGELYLTIGNFYNDSLSDTLFLNSGEFNWLYSYYYIDDVSVIPLDSLIGIGEKEEVKFKLFPNPSKGRFMIQLNETQKNVVVELFDMSGRKIFETEERNTIEQIKFDTFGLKAGIYSVRISFENGASSWQKLVISP